MPQFESVAGGFALPPQQGRQALTTLPLEIPESIVRNLRLTEPEIESRLRSELAIALYGQGILPFGKAAELAGASRYGFAELSDSRQIARHETDDDLTQDLDYARGR
jgi:predicted HTH domain antitoxin